MNRWLLDNLRLLEVAHEAYSGRNGEPSSVFPPSPKVFRAFEYFEPEETKVVLLGQDPYHTRGKASGLAFGYDRDYIGQLDSSLHNVVSELLACGIHVPGYSDGQYGSQKKDYLTLEHWAEQGVLLLNTRLTVFEGKPMSHAGQNPGWNQAIADLIKYIDQMHRRDSLVRNGVTTMQDSGLVWMLWGAEAQRAASEVQGTRIATSHPCKYSHRATTSPFTGSRCFSKVNEALIQIGKEPIKW